MRSPSRLCQQSLTGLFSSDLPTRIYQLFPRDEEEDELAGFRKAHANAVAWNSAESVRRRDELERIIQKDQEKRAANRREKYEMLNDLANELEQNGMRTDTVTVNGD